MKSIAGPRYASRKNTGRWAGNVWFNAHFAKYIRGVFTNTHKCVASMHHFMPSRLRCISVPCLRDQHIFRWPNEGQLYKLTIAVWEQRCRAIDCTPRYIRQHDTCLIRKSALILCQTGQPPKFVCLREALSPPALAPNSTERAHKIGKLLHGVYSHSYCLI